MSVEKVGRLPLRGTVAASPSGLSRLRRLRGVASTIAGALPHPIALFACAAICIAADLAIWRIA